MRINPVSNCILIIRSQAEYSPATETLSVRFVLEVPAKGQHYGFVDVEALLKALKIELVETHQQIIPADHKESKT